MLDVFEVMNILELSAGDIVYSLAGRDKDKIFIVLEVLDENFVLLADGDLRRVQRPKKKKIKHLKKTNITAERIREKLSEGIKVTNTDLRRILAELENEQEGTIWQKKEF